MPNTPTPTTTDTYLVRSIIIWFIVDKYINASFSVGHQSILTSALDYLNGPVANMLRPTSKFLSTHHTWPVFHDTIRSCFSYL